MKLRKVTKENMACIFGQVKKFLSSYGSEEELIICKSFFAKNIKPAFMAMAGNSQPDQDFSEEKMRNNYFLKRTKFHEVIEIGHPFEMDYPHSVEVFEGDSVALCSQGLIIKSRRGLDEKTFFSFIRKN